MPQTDDICTAVYAMLAADDAVTSLCTVRKGRKRPVNASSPTATVDVRRLERGEGEGIWMCDVIVTIHAGLLSNRAPDHGTHALTAAAVTNALAGKTPSIANASVLPLIEGESGGTDWDADHDGESRQELVFGLVFVKFF